MDPWLKLKLISKQLIGVHERFMTPPNVPIGWTTNIKSQVPLSNICIAGGLLHNVLVQDETNLEHSDCDVFITNPEQADVDFLRNKLCSLIMVLFKYSSNAAFRSTCATKKDFEMIVIAKGNCISIMNVPDNSDDPNSKTRTVQLIANKVYCNSQAVVQRFDLPCCQVAWSPDFRDGMELDATLASRYYFATRRILISKASLVRDIRLQKYTRDYNEVINVDKDSWRLGLPTWTCSVQPGKEDGLIEDEECASSTLYAALASQCRDGDIDVNQYADAQRSQVIERTKISACLSLKWSRHSFPINADTEEAKILRSVQSFVDEFMARPDYEMSYISKPIYCIHGTVACCNIMPQMHYDVEKLPKWCNLSQLSLHHSQLEDGPIMSNDPDQNSSPSPPSSVLPQNDSVTYFIKGRGIFSYVTCSALPNCIVFADSDANQIKIFHLLSRTVSVLFENPNYVKPRHLQWFEEERTFVFMASMSSSSAWSHPICHLHINGDLRVSMNNFHKSHTNDFAGDYHFAYLTDPVNGIKSAVFLPSAGMFRGLYLYTKPHWPLQLVDVPKSALLPFSCKYLISYDHGSPYRPPRHADDFLPDLPDNAIRCPIDTVDLLTKPLTSSSKVELVKRHNSSMDESQFVCACTTEGLVIVMNGSVYCDALAEFCKVISDEEPGTECDFAFMDPKSPLSKTFYERNWDYLTMSMPPLPYHLGACDFRIITSDNSSLHCHLSILKEQWPYIRNMMNLGSSEEEDDPGSSTKLSSSSDIVRKNVWNCAELNAGVIDLSEYFSRQQVTALLWMWYYGHCGGFNARFGVLSELISDGEDVMMQFGLLDSERHPTTPRMRSAMFYHNISQLQLRHK